MADTYRVRCDSTQAGWVGAGAAAIGLDPLSSNGICFALRSGLDAARAVAAHLEGNATAIDDYSISLDRFFDEYLVQRSSYYEMDTRWPDSPFWSARQPATLSTTTARELSGRTIS
jgi:flavin-dependent dehydrogenase